MKLGPTGSTVLADRAESIRSPISPGRSNWAAYFTSGRINATLSRHWWVSLGK